MNYPNLTGNLKEVKLIKRWLSHLVELPVAEYNSEHNAELQVVLHKGRYKLLTNGAIYSFSDLYSNYRKTFERLDWSRLHIKSCLVLGLGLGSIPDMLISKFKKNIKFTAVEIDELVIQLALEYVLRPKKINVDIFTADAALFLEWHHGKYDMICSDVFVGDRIPADLQTEEALFSMKEMLLPDGLLLYNRLSRFSPDMKAGLKFLDDVFLKVFPEGGYIDVDGNWMFINRMSAFK
jgi:spermidine synthase